MSDRPWRKRHLFFLLGVGVTPVALCAGVLSAGGGHGSYVLAKLLFPFTMALTLVCDNTIAAPLAVLAVAQYPIYGLLLDWAAADDRLPSVTALLFLLHALAAVFSFAVLRNFG